MELDSYSNFSQQLNDVVKKYPNLTIKSKNGISYLKGILDITNDENIDVGSFSIEIKWKAGFPYCFPILFEVGNDIPNIDDWHKYADSSCCITVEADEILECKNGITLLQFIKNHAFPHLANQLYRKKFGTYKNGEFSHGISGIIQYYNGLMKTSNSEKWIEYFDIAFRGKKIKCGRNDLCFCGSKDKYKKCHNKVFETLHSIGYKQVLKDLKMIIK